MDGYYTSAIDPGISNWDMQAPSNTINGALPMRTNTNTRSRLSPRRSRGINQPNNLSITTRNSMKLQQNSENNEKFNSLISNRFKIFNDLNEKTKSDLYEYASKNIVFPNEEAIRNAFMIPTNKNLTDSYLDLYNWIRKNKNLEDSTQNEVQNVAPEPEIAQNVPTSSETSNEITNNVPTSSETTNDPNIIPQDDVDIVPTITDPSNDQTQNVQTPVQNVSTSNEISPTSTQNVSTPTTPAPVSTQPKVQKPKYRINRLPGDEDSEEESQNDEEEDADQTQQDADQDDSPKNETPSTDSAEKIEDTTVNPKNKATINDLDKSPVVDDIDYDPSSYNYLSDAANYPFRSKIEAYLKAHPGADIHTYAKIVDKNPRKNDTKELHRPSYSVRPNAYQIDIMFTAENTKAKPKYYLVMININTRYLMVRHISDKTEDSVMRAISDMINTENIKIDYINGDAERAFIGMQKKLERYWKEKQNGTVNERDYTNRYGDYYSIYDQEPFKMRFEKNDFTFHNKLVDSVIRTIRNAAGLNPNALRDDQIIQRIVKYYNDTPHVGLLINPQTGINYTPRDMQDDINLEWAYIRQKDKELQKVTKKQEMSNLTKYKRGNVLRLHLNWAKTKMKFKKRRMVYENIGVFDKYVNGNCKVYVLNINKFAEVPIFYTDKIADSVHSIPDNYRAYYNINNDVLKIPDYLTAAPHLENNKAGTYVVPSPDGSKGEEIEDNEEDEIQNVDTEMQSPQNDQDPNNPIRFLPENEYNSVSLDNDSPIMDNTSMDNQNMDINTPSLDINTSTLDNNDFNSITPIDAQNDLPSMDLNLDNLL